MDNLLKHLTNFKFGGSAKKIITAESEIELIATLKDLKFKKAKYYILGGGTNIIANDKGYKGTIVKISASGLKIENQKTIEYLRAKLSDEISVESFSLGFIDAATSGNELDEKNGGVGLARKIGMDAALSLFNYRSSKKKILVCPSIVTSITEVVAISAPIETSPDAHPIFIYSNA